MITVNDELYFRTTLENAIKYRHKNPVTVATEAVTMRDRFRTKQQKDIADLQKVMDSFERLIVIEIDTPFGRYPLIVPREDRDEIKKLMEEFQKTSFFKVHSVS